MVEAICKSVNRRLVMRTMTILRGMSLLSHLFSCLSATPPVPSPPPPNQRLPYSPPPQGRGPAGQPLLSAKITALEHLLVMRPTETPPAHPAGAEPLIKLYLLCLSVIQLGAGRGQLELVTTLKHIDKERPFYCLQ